jgi:hypothetical protein
MFAAELTDYLDRSWRMRQLAPHNAPFASWRVTLAPPLPTHRTVSSVPREVAMSSETRTLLVVLVLCAFVALMCLIVPIGIGAVLFFRVQQQQVAVQAEFNQAVAAQERMQAEAAARHTEMQQQIESQMGTIPPIGMPPPGFGPPGMFPGEPPLPTPPPPGFGGAPPGVLPGASAPNEQQRRTIYRTVKSLQQLEAQFAELSAAAPDDPAMQQAAAQIKTEKDNALRQLAAQYNITPAQLDEIVAEGEKAGW